MGTRLNPYLNFNGNAAEAMEFYHGIFGGNLTRTSFGDMGGVPEGFDPNGTMHAQLETPGGFTLMAADMPPGSPLESGNNFSVSLSGDDEDELREWWQKLSDGGQVTMALEPQMGGDTFGMCVDRFGIPWMVNIVGDHSQEG